MNRREGFKGMNAKNFTETWFELLTETSINQQLVKKVWIFPSLNVKKKKKKTQRRLNLPSLFSPILCSSFLFVDDLFLVCFLELFVFPSNVALRRWIFAFRLNAFSSSLSRSSRRILPIFVSFLAPFTPFTSCFLSVTLSLSFQPILTQNSSSTQITIISSGWKSCSNAGINALQADQKLQITERYCSITTSPVWFPAQNAGCK